MHEYSHACIFDHSLQDHKGGKNTILVYVKALNLITRNHKLKLVFPAVGVFKVINCPNLVSISQAKEDSVLLMPLKSLPNMNLSAKNNYGWVSVWEV